MSMHERIAEIERRIEAACARAGRDAGAVRLVAVSKTHGAEAVDEARRAGVRIFGENRIQEAAVKIEQCGSAEWHFIGHLQRNKVKVAVPLFSMIHSVDSMPLLEAVAECMEATGCRPALLMEVNVAGDGAKFGFKPDAVPEALRRAAALGVAISGFMTMPPFAPTAEAARPHFRRLRELRDIWQEGCAMDLSELSMGMSHDFEVAIEEGATLVRVGTALFGERQSSFVTRRSSLVIRDGCSSDE